LNNQGWVRWDASFIIRSVILLYASLHYLWHLYSIPLFLPLIWIFAICHWARELLFCILLWTTNINAGLSWHRVVVLDPNILHFTTFSSGSLHVCIFSNSSINKMKVCCNSHNLVLWEWTISLCNFLHTKLTVSTKHVNSSTLWDSCEILTLRNVPKIILFS